MGTSPFRVPPKIEQRLRFLRVPPERRVCIVASPDQFLTLELHCSEHGSTVCVNKQECPTCRAGDTATRLYSFAPCFLQGSSGGIWQRHILPIGDPHGVVADKDLRGYAVTVFKLRHRDGSEAALDAKAATKIDDAIVKRYGLLWFDIAPRLLQRYGLNADGSAAGQPIEQPAQVDDAQGEPDVLAFNAAAAKQSKRKAKGA